MEEVSTTLQGIEVFKSIKEFAGIVKIPEASIRRMVKEGKLPAVPRGEKHVLIPLKAGADRLVELSLGAMKEQREYVAAVTPIDHLAQYPPTWKANRKGRAPDSIRLGRAAR